MQGRHATCILQGNLAELGVLCMQAVFAGLAVVAAIAALVVRKVCTPSNPQNPKQ